MNGSNSLLTVNHLATSQQLMSHDIGNNISPTNVLLNNDISSPQNFKSQMNSSSNNLLPHPILSSNICNQIPKMDYFGLFHSSNATDSRELDISHTSPNPHDLPTPSISLLNSNEETNHFSFNFDNISVGKGSPFINNIATPLAPHSIPSSNASHVANSEEPLILISESNNVARADEDIDDLTKLKNIRLSNVNRLIVAQLNINSLRNKFHTLIDIVSGKVDILVLTETKLDETFPKNQFLI